MRFRTPLIAIACLVVGASGAIGVAIGDGQTNQTTIADIEYTGQGAVDIAESRLYLWQSKSHEFTVTIESSAQLSSGELCLFVLDAGNDTALGCQTVSLTNHVETVAISISDWPANATNEQILGVRLLDQDTGDIVATKQLSVTVIQKESDRDGDGLTNQREVRIGTSPIAVDTDHDRLDDHDEVEIYQTKPTVVDSDSDRLTDGIEIEMHHTDPNSIDTDEDALSDGAEIRSHQTNPNKADTDGDRLTDSSEVNTYQTDPNIADTDSDGLGDGAEVTDIDTDPTGTDTDSDGLDDGREQTIYLTDPTIVDTDGDGLDDAAEIEVYQTNPTTKDTDGDGLVDGAEIDTHGTDPNAVDTDSDGLSDGIELRRGTSPTDPTATRGSPVQVIIGFLSRWTSLLLGSVFVFGLGILVMIHWWDVLPFRRAPLEYFGTGDEMRTTETRTGETEAADGSSTDATDPIAGTDTVSENGTAVLTKEERVFQLLSTNGGRMLQSDIVEADDWSKATVSRVLSRMEEKDEVTRIDVGKGNLVTLPGEEPDSAASVFTDT